MGAGKTPWRHAGRVGLCCLKMEDVKSREAAALWAQQNRRGNDENIEAALCVHMHTWEYLTWIIGTLHRKTDPKSNVQHHMFQSTDISKQPAHIFNHLWLRNSVPWESQRDHLCHLTPTGQLLWSLFPEWLGSLCEILCLVNIHLSS